MIALPKFSQIPFGVLLMGGIGCTLGHFAQVDKKLSAIVLSVTSLANDILYLITNRTIGRLLKISPEVLYVATNTLVSTIAIVAANHLKLISRHMAAVLMMGSVAILCARLRILIEMQPKLR